MIDLTKLTTPFGLLDEVHGKGTQAALKAHGGPYEIYTTVNGWQDFVLYALNGKENCVSDWCHRSHAIRVKPVTFIPDSIDWSHVAGGFDWMARDEDGEPHHYDAEPEVAMSHWLIGGGGELAISAASHASYRRGTVDWRDSLVRRPT